MDYSLLQHFDWFGPIEELKEIDKKMKKACDETDGVELLGRYGPGQKKYHWTWIFKAEDYNLWNNLTIDYVRDYNVVTHVETELYHGPQ